MNIENNIIYNAENYYNTDDNNDYNNDNKNNVRFGDQVTFKKSSDNSSCWGN